LICLRSAAALSKNYWAVHKNYWAVHTKIFGSSKPFKDGGLLLSPKSENKILDAIETL
jgi:hypothetical protein